ncbi:hypothetical protein W02_03960 [Nitrospira sp. KM1]|uniref:DUF5989 family protein n=1 Tax=Nitrospira sp. KM1 TaxID=1936990 RepID=UPI0013A73D21|nr:DUF5989 family protein [Nitrospira sp. KM1]BCA53256.1 hypothetical protein W02_03960 [Nitrospira sp. KM1]
MSLVSGARDYSQLIHDVQAYVMERRSYWLAPLIFAILMLATLAFFLEGSVMAPAIYSIF